MSYIVNFTPEAKKALAKIKKSNQNLWKKTDKILHELVEDPRIIYDIYDNTLVVLVLQLEGHYDDK